MSRWETRDVQYIVGDEVRMQGGKMRLLEGNFGHSTGCATRCSGECTSIRIGDEGDIECWYSIASYFIEGN